MPLIIPTPTLEKLKKFPSQVFISVLLVLVGYFINVAIRSKTDNAEDWKKRALITERKLDSVTVVLSELRDAVIRKDEGYDLYQKGAKKIDSITHEIIKPKSKAIIKRK